MTTVQKYINLILLGLCAAVITKVPYMREIFHTAMTEGLNISNQELGEIYGVVGTVSVIGYLIGGIIADKFNTKMLLILSLLGAAASIFWFSTLPSVFIIKLIHIFIALFSLVTFWCAYLKGIRMLGTAEEQGRVFGWAECARGISGVVVSIIAVYVMEQAVTKTGGLQATLWYYGTLHILLAAGVWKFMPSTEADNEETGVFSFASIKEVVKMPALWFVLLVIFGLYAIMILITYTGPYLETVWAAPAATVGILASIRQFGLATIGTPLGGIYCDKIGSPSKTVMQCSVLLVLSTAAFFVIPKSASIYLVYFIVLLVAFMMFAARGAQWATMTEGKIPVGVTGTALGIICTIAYTTDIYINIQVGAWMDKYPPEQAFNMVFGYIIFHAVVAFFGALGIYRLSKKNSVTPPLSEVEKQAIA